MDFYDTPRSIDILRERMPNAHMHKLVKWRSPSGGYVGPIDIDWVGGLPGNGMHLGEIESRGPEMSARHMIDGSERPFEGMRVDKITFRIEWPGYPHANVIYHVDVAASGRAFTKAEIAFQVSKIFRKFCQRAEREKQVPDIPNWKIGGPYGICFGDIILVRIVNLGDSQWQADLLIQFKKGALASAGPLTGSGR
ncbi:hypothetical protein OF83DRAFT_1096715 [Amylostereum chailletii]|nr:hypothetical protein OF83DRAFT_1096715 [Amylostereum chailletii]